MVWHELPSPLSAPARHVTAVPRGRDRIDLFGVGVDDAVATTSWTRAGGWAADWTSVVPSGRFPATQRVAAVSRDDVSLDLFVVDADGDIRTAGWTPGRGWSPEWGSLQIGAQLEPAEGHVTALSPSPDRIELFGVGVNSAVWTMAWADIGGWTQGGALRPSGRFSITQQLTALSRGRHGIDVFLVDDDNAVSTLSRPRGRDWDLEWTRLPPGSDFDVAVQHVAAVAPGSGRLHLFAVGANDAVWNEHFDDDLGWNTEWITISDGGTVDHTQQTVAALSPAPGRTSVFALGKDGTLRRADDRDGFFGDATWTAVPGAPELDPKRTRLVAAEPGVPGTRLFAVSVDDAQSTTVGALLEV